LDNEYSTAAFGRRARDVFQRNNENPQFVFLSLNAPHSPVLAPPEEREKFRQMFPTESDSRIELLAAIRAVDNEMKKLVEIVNGLDRETLIIFQSDNGGRTFSHKGRKLQESCNFPYKETESQR